MSVIASRDRSCAVNSERVRSVMEISFHGRDLVGEDCEASYITL